MKELTIKQVKHIIFNRIVNTDKNAEKYSDRDYEIESIALIYLLAELGWIKEYKDWREINE